MRAASSSFMILTTCWPGLSESRTPAPRQRSFTWVVNALTTLKLTSASSRARRISRMALSTSASVSFPLERTSERVAWRRSESWSNTGCEVRPSAELLCEERLGELARLEGPQVLEALAHADQLHRYAQLAGD